ncbi:MAG: DUF167 domain-containing protein [Alphaproteobacteria bacterium]
MAKPTYDWAALGSTLHVRVTPKASRNGVEHALTPDGSPLLRVYITTVPEDGKANAAVLKLLAKELGIAKSRLTITHGLTSRDKVIQLS